MSNALIDHYKQVRARMGMAPPRAVVKPRLVELPVVAAFARPVVTPRVVRRPKPLWQGQPLSSIHIQFTVADYYNISRDEMISQTRRPKFVRARQVAMYLCRRLTKSSFPQIGAQFRRDHTTVVYSEARVERLIEGSEEIAGEVMELHFILTGKYPSTYFGA